MSDQNYLLTFSCEVHMNQVKLIGLVVLENEVSPCCAVRSHCLNSQPIVLGSQPIVFE